MFVRIVSYCAGALVVAALVLAGPVAGTLALSGVKSPQAVALLSDAPALVAYRDIVADPRSASVIRVQDATIPGEVEEKVDPTPNQTVVIEWGNWVDTLLSPIQAAALSIVPAIVGWLLLQIPAIVRIVLPARRVNELIENAIKSGFAQVKGLTQGKTLSVEITNDWLRKAAIYAIAQAPHLVEEAAKDLPILLQKLMARLPDFAGKIPAGYSSEVATKAITPDSIQKEANKQGDSVAVLVEKYLGQSK